MPKKQKKDDRDDNSGSDSEEDNFGEDGPRPLDWLKANMDPTTATGEKEEIVSNNDDEGNVSDDDKDSMSIEVDSGDAASEFIESFVSKEEIHFIDVRCAHQRARSHAKVMCWLL